MSHKRTFADILYYFGIPRRIRTVETQETLWRESLKKVIKSNNISNTEIDHIVRDYLDESRRYRWLGHEQDTDQIFGTLTSICAENYCAQHPDTFFSFDTLYAYRQPKRFHERVSQYPHLFRQAKGTKQNPLRIHVKSIGSSFAHYSDNLIVKSEDNYVDTFLYSHDCTLYAQHLNHVPTVTSNNCTTYSYGKKFIDGKKVYSLEGIENDFAHRRLGFEKKMKLSDLAKQFSSLKTIIEKEYGEITDPFVRVTLDNKIQLSNLDGLLEYGTDSTVRQPIVESYFLSFLTQDKTFRADVFPTIALDEYINSAVAEVGAGVNTAIGIGLITLDAVFLGGLATAIGLAFGGDSLRRSFNSEKGMGISLRMYPNTMEFDTDTINRYTVLKKKLESKKKLQ